jgi:hypothetical protein
MFYSAIDSMSDVKSVSATDDAEFVSLSERVSAATQDNLTTQSGEGVELDETVKNIFDWFIANKEQSTTDPTALTTQLIRKIQSAQDAEGNRVYKTPADIMAACATLEKAYKQDGDTSLDDFFSKTRSTVFGLTIFTQNIMDNIFFPSDDSKIEDIF